MNQYNWKEFSVKVTIEASKDSIFDAWSTQEMLELWFLRKADFTGKEGELKDQYDKIAKGDTYAWFWHGHDDESAEFGKILMTPEEEGYLQFSFGKAGICSIYVHETEQENILEIKQEQIPDDENGKIKYHLGCMQGWSFYATNLKSLLEGGIDLRNKNIKIKGVINS